MVDLARYRSVLVVGAGLGLALLALDGGLSVAADPPPAWLVPQATAIGWSHVDNADRRVAGLVAKRRRGSLGGPFGVYFGMSSAVEGIDPDVLTAESGTGGRYVGVCGYGKSMALLLMLARPLLRSPLKPDVVLVCLHPGWLVGNPAAVPTAHRSPLPALRQGNWRAALHAAEDWPWVTSFRTLINHFVRTKLYDARADFFDRLHLGADVFSPPDLNPWRPPERWGTPHGPQRAEEAFLREQLANWQGWFDPAQYAAHQEAQAAALVELVTQFRQQGSEVFVVLMPEAPALRERLPPEGRTFLTAALARAYGGSPPLFLDFQGALPDALFYDYVHVNDAGRAEFSRRLARAVRAHREDQAGPSAPRP